MTTIERDEIIEAYDEVRDDLSETCWLVCKYDGNIIRLASKGESYEQLQNLLSDDETAFAFARIVMTDEVSKQPKFVFITWAGANLEVLQRAKLSVDKGLVKEVIQNFAVEIVARSLDEVALDNIRAALSKVGGADYATVGGE